jgi:uncharacterized protein YPO0396
MPTLFDVDQTIAGFRLKYLEIYNWGTFDDKIWRLTPDGQHSLLTGANGSGKTTIVDALLTLLVPTTKRYYNQSAGVENRRERDEKSYCLGAYSTIQPDNGAAAKTQYLRTKDSYSILLACFGDQAFHQQITLAQVRWFSGDDLKKVFIFSPYALTIQEHFSPLDPQGEWKRRLKSLEKTEIFDAFTHYCQKFSKTFGLKSEKALNLFAHTVGIKVLGNFNEFIRTNMLEESDVEEEFQKLHELYNNLLSVHNTIAKAREQLLLLEPIIEKGKQFTTLNQELQEIEALAQIVPAHFAREKVTLLEAAITEKQVELQRVEHAMEELRAELTQFNAQRTDLEIAISKDETGEQIRNIEREIAILEKERDAKKRKAEEYNAIAKALDYPTNPEEQDFFDTLARAQEHKTRIEEQLPALHEQWSDYRSVQTGYQAQSKELLEELRSLESRQNQIPLKNIEIRRGILQQLGISEDQMPFVGELIRVRHSEKAWESAIERLLNNLGLVLLVQEKYYKQVNQYVNSTNLQGRLVYYRVDLHQLEEPAREDISNSLLSKLDLNPDSLFHDWIEAHLHAFYDYVCTDNLEDFQRYEKALTKEGLLKHGFRHEKDDRPQVLSKSNYVLGWDNREKMDLIQAKRRDLDKQMQQNVTRIKEIEAQREKLTKTRDLLNKLLQLTYFTELDWRKPVLKIEQLNAETLQLKESSDHLRELETQLRHAKDQISIQQRAEERLGEQKINLRRDIQDYQKQIAENATVLQAFAHVNLDHYVPILADYLPQPGVPCTLDTIGTLTTDARNTVYRALENVRAEKSKFEIVLVRKMHAFKTPTEDILQKYPTWTVDTVDLEDSPDAIGEYDRLYQRIKHEDLPRHEERFKTWLNERVIVNFASFEASLDKQLKTIKESIKELNESLKQIKFHSTPPTYIQIDSKEVRDYGETGITTFRHALRDVFANISRLHDPQELEVSFRKIKAIVEKLIHDEPWRKKVTDVRNWLEFGAIEKHSLDDTARQYYDDSQGLSGGEKAKLAYTILASAIAYQFGINHRIDQFKSFRFVVVDEAFSKVDPENARFAMDLFQQLNLQLMVVTPLDKINIVEKYIHSVHYVENKHRKNSAVYDLTMQEYYERKEALKHEAVNL